MKKEAIKRMMMNFRASCVKFQGSGYPGGVVSIRSI